MAADDVDTAATSTTTKEKTQEPINIERRRPSRLHIVTFKIIARKVEIGSFHNCLAAVVGPNGSGKSIVIDALLFVFGKKASKLRLQRVSELVHCSADFPDLDMATVLVFFQETIDTDEGDADAVTDNEVNYTVVPSFGFKLLQEKGIDLDNNRCLILQGEVEQIAMMKSKGAEGTNEEGLL
ncbi:unnamed protein product [Peronospora effusa]|nr:unnamed protein product [Peronospora effusa]